MARGRTSRWSEATAGWWFPGGTACRLPSGARREAARDSRSPCGCPPRSRLWFAPPGCGRCPAHGTGPDVAAARPMATLAIDAFRQPARIQGLAAGFVMPAGNLRVGVVAEHAFVGDGSDRQRKVPVMPRAHAPHATGLRV